MHPNVERVVAAAAAGGLDVEVHEFPDGTGTAGDAAAAIGCSLGQIVKSLVFTAGDEVVVALVSGPNRLDESRLSTVAGTGGVGRADAGTVRQATGFPIGGVPPFGHTTSLRTFIDRDLLGYDVVWAAAGTPRHVFPLAPPDLLRLTAGVDADLVAL